VRSRDDSAEVGRRARRHSRTQVSYSAGFDAELGGMQLPVTVAQAALALFFSANVGTAAYPMLTIGNANLIRKFGTDAQQRDVPAAACCRGASPGRCACRNRRRARRCPTS
jgi:alkylation response protein AidB-like acyl-CoA dehydrogenase